jgi:branched-chain amino acid transport system permease protein
MAYTLGADQFYLIAYALLFLVVIILLPQGIVPTVGARLRRRRMRRAQHEPGPPGPTPDPTGDPSDASAPVLRGRP